MLHRSRNNTTGWGNRCSRGRTGSRRPWSPWRRECECRKGAKESSAAAAAAGSGGAVSFQRPQALTRFGDFWSAGIGESTHTGKARRPLLEYATKQHYHMVAISTPRSRLIESSSPRHKTTSRGIDEFEILMLVVLALLGRDHGNLSTSQGVHKCAIAIVVLAC